MRTESRYDELIALLDRHHAAYRVLTHAPEGRTDIVSAMRGHPIDHAAKYMVVMVKVGKKTTLSSKPMASTQPVSANCASHTSVIDRERITQTHGVIRPFVRHTPTIEIDGAECRLSSCTVVLKLELLQHTGSFKVRGAFANMLLRDVPPAGVVALQIHAYDQAETLLGQGSVGRELDEDAAHLDTLLVAVGGGGLLGGIASWYAGGIRLIGVEPEEAPTLTSALAAGCPVDAKAGGIAADSLAPKRVGQLMFPIAQRYVDRVVLVSDEDIQAAQRMLWDLLRIVTEPGGAAAFAALISARYRPSPRERVGVVLCGANTTVDLAAER